MIVTYAPYTSKYKPLCCHVFNHIPRISTDLPTLLPLADKDHRLNISAINEYLFSKRILFVGEWINESVANKLISSLLFLEVLDCEREIKLYINCAGGSTYEVLAIADVLMQLKCPVSTIAIGMVASPSPLLLAAGSMGRRLSTHNARILINQPEGLLSGSFSEVKIKKTELSRTSMLISCFYSKLTGMKREWIEKKMSRDFFLSRAAAKDLGIIDEIIF